MADLQATLDAIAEVAVHRCGHCDEPLATDAPSPDFCGPLCQQAWTREQAEIVELVGYREPLDMAAHASNQVELSSPETRIQLANADAIYEALGRSAPVELIDVTALGDPVRRWAPPPTDAPTASSDLAAYQAVVDDAVRELARQAGIPPDLLPNLAEYIVVPLRIVGGTS